MAWSYRVAEFQPFGDVWIRIDKIAAVDFSPGSQGSSRVYIHLVANEGLVLTDKQADAFKAWWDGHRVIEEGRP